MLKPLHAAYGVLGLFLVAERLLRRGAEARSFVERPTDRGTTRAIGIAFGVGGLALDVAPILNRRGIARLYGTGPAWVGVLIMAGGLALRIWAARVLGAFYTRTLRTSAQQHIVASGPYRLVRHPGYLGDILLWLGAAVASANGIAALAITAAMGRAYHARMVAEEAMLAETFGEVYPPYAGRTWRLIPFVY